MAIDDYVVFRAGPFWVEELDGRFLVRERMARGAETRAGARTLEAAAGLCRHFANQFPDGTKNQHAKKRTKPAATAAA